MTSRAPHTSTDEVVEQLHGHTVSDPYRWLEEPDSQRTLDWVRDQRGYCDEVLSGLPGRSWFQEVMGAVTARPRTSAPWRQGGHWLVSRNDGTQDQDVVMVGDSLGELLESPRVLVDPNTWSEDGSASLATLRFNRRGDLAAVGRSEAGSDWTHISLIGPDGGPVDDAPIITKFCNPVWLPDGSSYLYNAFPGAARADGADASALPAARIRRHRVGDDPSQDVEIWTFVGEPRDLALLKVSDDDRWLVAEVFTGTETANRVWLFPLSDRGGSTVVGERLELIDKATNAWSYLGSVGGELYFTTDDDAPRARLVAIHDGEWTIREVVPEARGILRSAVLADDALVVEHLVDASPVLTRSSLDGDRLGRVEVPGGSVVGCHGATSSSEVFLGMSTINESCVPWRLDVVDGSLRRLVELEGHSHWEPPAHRIERRTGTSADGTRVPYFLVFPDSVTLDEPRPTIVYGYGGFSIPVAADHRPIWPGWLAAGGVIAIANLRGGGEFGRDWYEQGIREGKQHVFDDLVAVAEALVADGVTTPAQLAVHGKSNGGLLVGAVMTQRPELFAVALPHVGVLDAVRFHRFTIGAAWISDYGNPDDPEDLERILSWSPLANVRPDFDYPATLVMTSDHDDRVVPAHSYKFTAAVQAAQAGDAPVAVRIEHATGHGLANRPPAVVAAECADMLAFAAHHTGLAVPCAPGRG